MKRAALLCPALVLSALSSGIGPAAAQESAAPPPVRSDVQEVEKVRLVLVETLALTGKSGTVPDLTREDFELKVGGKKIEIDTFDALCPVGAQPDPPALKPGDRVPAPIAPSTPRKIVFVFDYFSIPQFNRSPVLDAAKWMVEMFKTPEEEIMVVALTDRLRIEQRFTKEKERVVEALNRMEHDVTLWGRLFGMGASGRTYLENLAGLMEVLEAYDGAKIALLFSELEADPQTRDLWFWDVAVRATLSRTVIYPNWVAGVQIGSEVMGSRILSRLANESGGRSAVFSGDLSVMYRKAQRDLSCRYALGFYLEGGEEERPQNIRVTTTREGVLLRYPEQIRLFSEEQKRAMRERAAFLDPLAHENPLVRAYALPMRPNGGSWDTLFALHFPLPMGTEPQIVDLKAHLRRGAKRTGDVEARIEVPARRDGMPGTQSVTVLGDATLKPGEYEFTIVLSRPGDRRVVSAFVPVRVPEVPSEGVFVRGPVLARVVPEGVLIRRDRDEKDEEPTQLDRVLRDHESIEPLVVHAVSRTEKFLAYWEACYAGKQGMPEGAKVHRRFYGEGGEVTLELEPLPFEPVAGKGKVRCQHALEEIRAEALPVHDYTFQVAVESSAGKILSRTDVPLDVAE